MLSLVLALIIVLLFTPFGVGAEPHRPPFFRGALRLPELLREISGKMASILNISRDPGTPPERDSRMPFRWKGASLVLAEGVVSSLITGRNRMGRGAPPGDRYPTDPLPWEKDPEPGGVEKLRTDAETREAFAGVFRPAWRGACHSHFPHGRGLAGLICLGQKKSGNSSLMRIWSS